MRHPIRLVVLAAIVGVVSIIAVWIRPVALPEASTVSIGGTTITVTLATSPTQRERGLSGRARLEPNNGMLFVFDAEGSHGIWMKDMNFAIDVLWLDNTGTIVDIAENVSPATFPMVFKPNTPARFVLELPALFAQNHSVKVGASILLPKE
ncbi:DUF192 domain-containing protein [Candidatus Uhrbacteria bacterium]|nr:DUF192 domain-containing protein [Candidatus Uhrbacteria bacterium]